MNKRCLGYSYLPAKSNWRHAFSNSSLVIIIMMEKEKYKKRVGGGAERSGLVVGGTWPCSSGFGSKSETL